MVYTTGEPVQRDPPDCELPALANGLTRLVQRPPGPAGKSVEKSVEKSAVLRDEAGDETVEFRVFLAERGDLAHRVQRGRVVLVGEQPADLG